MTDDIIEHLASIDVFEDHVVVIWIYEHALHASDVWMVKQKYDTSFSYCPNFFRKIFSICFCKKGLRWFFGMCGNCYGIGRRKRDRIGSRRAPIRGWPLAIGAGLTGLRSVVPLCTSLLMSSCSRGKSRNYLDSELYISQISFTALSSYLDITVITFSPDTTLTPSLTLPILPAPSVFPRVHSPN